MECDLGEALGFADEVSVRKQNRLNWLEERWP